MKFSAMSISALATLPVLESSSKMRQGSDIDVPQNIADLAPNGLVPQTERIDFNQNVGHVNDSKLNPDLGILRQLSSDSDSSDDDDCKTGTFEEILEFCDEFDEKKEKCCYIAKYGKGVSGLACFGSPKEEVTICRGACRGFLSCADIEDGSVVEEYSCQGLFACEDSYVNVSPHSCIGMKACKYSHLGDVGIGSCIGIKACKYSHLGDVGSHSCLGKYACKYSDIKGIGCSACGGRGSCEDVKGKYIESYSCQGTFSCFNADVGLYGGSGTIGTYSCIFRGACEDLEIKSVGDYACIGVFSCEDFKDSDGTIGDNECQEALGGGDCEDCTDCGNCNSDDVCA